MTNIEAFRDGVKLVREAAGPEVFLLGCCVSQNMRSFGGSFGLLDAMRVGPGHGRRPHRRAARLAAWFLNGRVWWNDPDCVSVRAATPLEQARLNASFTAIAGDLFYNSDWMPDLPPERLDILRRCIPPHDLAPRPVDVFESQPSPASGTWPTRARPRRRDVVALYNWDKNPRDHFGSRWSASACPPARSTWASISGPTSSFRRSRMTFEADLPAGGSCRILAIRPVAGPSAIAEHLAARDPGHGGRDRGAMGRRRERRSRPRARWSPAILTSFGSWLPVGEKSWQAAAVSVSADDQAAG